MDWLIGIFLMCLGAIAAVGLMGLFFERWSGVWFRPEIQRSAAEPFPAPSDAFLTEGRTACMDQSCTHHKDRLGQNTCHDCLRSFCQDCLYEAANPHVGNRKERRCKRCYNEWLTLLDAEMDGAQRSSTTMRRAPLQIVSGTEESPKMKERVWGRADELRRGTKKGVPAMRTPSYPREDSDSDWISEAPTRLLDPNSHRRH